MDINDKVNILYNAIYSQNSDLKNKISKIDLENITLDDIKFKYIQNEKYNDILSEIFSGNFKLLTFNDQNMTTVLKKYSDDLSLHISISPYKNLKDVNSFEDTNNNDSIISYVLSELVINNKTKHILLPIMNIDTEIQQISDILQNIGSFNDYNLAIQNNLISNVFSVKVKENFSKVCI